jgi:hypothetical protein
MSSLKKSFTSKRLYLISEAIEVINEDVDRETVKNAVSIIKKLQAIDFSNLPLLDQARDEVISDLASVASGDDKRGLLSKLAGFFKSNDANNPMYAALAFGSAVKSFFTLFSEFVNSIATKNGTPPNGADRILDLLERQNVVSQVHKLATNGFKPQGKIFKKIGTDWQKKYIKALPSDIADEIMNLSFDELNKVIGAVKQATSGVPQIVQNLPAAPQQSTTPAVPSAGTPQKAAVVDAYWNKIKTRFTAANKNDATLIKSVIETLIDAGELK